MRGVYGGATGVADLTAAVAVARGAAGLTSAGKQLGQSNEGDDRNRTGVDGFAGRCVTTPPRRR